jgi:hypothetical protein
VKSNQDCKLLIKVGEKSIESNITATNNDFEILNLGEVEISGTGNQIIALNPLQENWGDVELMYVELIKI